MSRTHVSIPLQGKGFVKPLMQKGQEGHIMVSIPLQGKGSVKVARLFDERNDAVSIPLQGKGSVKLI